MLNNKTSRTINVKENTHRQLMLFKIKVKAESLDEVIKMMIKRFRIQ